MEIYNLTSSDPSMFILRGIPGLEAEHIQISIPFPMFYIVNLLGNFTLLYVVSNEQPLYKPMFPLLCMLALTDISISTCVVPKALCIFRFRSKVITVDGCLRQMFFIHAIATMHSGVLVTMMFDCHVTIGDPLSYSTGLTNARMVKLGPVDLIRSVCLILPEHLLLKRLPFCAKHVISHTCCMHIAVVKLLCGDTTVNRTYGLMIIFVIIGLDLILIDLSYGMIIRAVLSRSCRKAHEKAPNTCTAHICAMPMSYTPSLFSPLKHTLGQGIAADNHVLLANLYLLVPPMLNPIIYGVKAKELRDKVGKYTCRM